jgi:3-dehydroquinate synthase
LLKVSGCKIFLLKLEGNKKNKNEKTLFSILNYLLLKQFSKKSVLISIGGGVLGDVCGLAASLYLRGMIYFHVPSTMTAMVDSCLGGKTAINYKNIINSIGTYHHADHVFIFNELIQGLPDKEFLAGIPEILKCGLIKKNKILQILITKKNKILNRDFDTLRKIIFETLTTKIFFFKNDIYEKHSRLFLNFGHTFAHAIEMATAKMIKNDLLRHGEAVGIGMMCEIFYANNKNKTIKIVEDILTSYGLPTRVTNKKKYDPVFLQKLQQCIYSFVFYDKKKINKHPRFISLKKLHRPRIEEMKNLDMIDHAIYKFIA